MFLSEQPWICLVTGSALLTLVFVPCTLLVLIVALTGCKCSLPAKRLNSCSITTCRNGANIQQCLILTF